MATTTVPPDAWQPLATLGGAFVAALLGSWGGAMRRFRQERALDRRLGWSEDVARTLADVKLSLEIARTFEEDPSEPLDAKLRESGKTQAKYIDLVKVEGVSALYAPHEVRHALEMLRERFDEIADRSSGWHPPELHKHMDDLNALMVEIDGAMLLHAKAFRRELRYDPLKGLAQAGANNDMLVIDQDRDDVQLIRAILNTRVTLDAYRSSKAMNGPGDRLHTRARAAG